MANFQHALHQVEIKSKHSWHSGKFASDQSFFLWAVHSSNQESSLYPFGNGKRLWRHVDGLQRGFDGIG